MTLFALTVYVLFHFGLDRDSLDGALAAGVLWVTLLLASVIGVSRLYASEREQGGWTRCCSPPSTAPRSSWPRPARCSSSSWRWSWWRCPLSRSCCSAPAWAAPCPSCSRSSCWATSGVAAVGALVGALAAETHARELITPLLLLPLLVPLLISCAQATEPLLRQDQGPEDLGRWLGLLTLYDVVFVLLSVAVFDYLLED